MALGVGTRLGPYEVGPLLGVGGMGEVYRARDTKLDRDVAIKVLPESFAADPERVARFEREAKTLASLNHPNIGQIYGIEDGPPGAGHHLRALVLELVEGPTLADRIARGPIPVDEALPIARQIAEALEAAHELGIIHRDLKPANVKLRQDGTVKVLDFGLAKALEAGAGSQEQGPAYVLSQSPTLSVAGTRMGVILGTAAYMSPEQAKGKAVDKRADIWAFGAVLYEMLTGTRPFDGADVSEILAGVIKSAPDWQALPSGTPPKLRALLLRCLHKDAKHRTRDVGDARIEIDEILAAPTLDVPAASALPYARGRDRVAWMLATGVVVSALTVGLLSLLGTQSSPAPQLRLTVALTSVFQGYSIKVSPDGRRIAYIASEFGTPLAVKQLDSEAVVTLEGTEGANGLFWSPDSQAVGFFAQGRLKRINLAGGPPQTLCSLGELQGIENIEGTWSKDGLILFGGGAGPLSRVSATGGIPTPASSLDVSRNEVSHLQPQWLPDGRRFLYLAQTRGGQNNGVYVGSLDGSPATLLVKSDLRALFWQPGYLLFVRDQALVAQRFDLQTLQLQGDVVPVASDVATFAAFGTVEMSVSDTGALVYSSDQGFLGNTEVVSTDRGGVETTKIGDPGAISLLRLSPDDGWLATVRSDRQLNSPADIWLTDLSRNISSRFTTDASGEFDPVWSPKAERIAFSSDRLGRMALFQQSRVAGRDAELLLDDPASAFMSDWSRDGKFLLYHQAAQKIYALPLEGDRKPVLVVDSPFVKDQAQFSPDTRWVAYNAIDSGRFEVYVTSFPSGSRTVKVSSGGGVQPRWRSDGQELFYLDLGGRMMAVDVKMGPSIEFGVPRVLFQTRVEPNWSIDLYDVTRDGRRFFLIVPVGTSTETPTHVVLNWRPNE